MSVSDKCAARFAMPLALFLCACAGLTSCNRLATPPAKQVLKDADAKVRDGDLLQAIDLYESALDGSPRSADIHYRLAVLYDDKLNDPLNAMHHLKRYLTLAPNGARAAEVKNFMKRDEFALVTTLSGDSVVSRAEAARLKNENLELRKQVEDHRLEARNAALTKDKHATPAPEKNAAGKANKRAAKSYVVQPGDTLASISRKFYKSSSGWKKIRDANGKHIGDPAKLKPGETVTIP